MKKVNRKRRVDTDFIGTVGMIDRYSTYPSNGLTPKKLSSLLREADQGEITSLAELFQEMTTKDPDLFQPLNTRKLAVKRLDYDIIGDDGRVRDFIAEKVESIKGFNDAIGDLLDAVPRGLSACWIEWAIDDGDIVVNKLHHVNQRSFRYGKALDPKADLNIVRRLTDENLSDGVELEPNKWIIHEVKATSGFAPQVQLMRVAVWMYLFKNFGWKSFVTFCEIYGVPLRIGKYPSGSVDEDAIIKLKTALRSLGIDASGVVPDTMQIEIVEAVKSGSTDNVHVKLIELASKAYQKAILGHTGTSESTPGKLGSEDAAREVKFELVEADAIALASTLSDQLIRPWVDFQFGEQKSYPYFKFVIAEPENLMNSVDVLQRAQNMGARIPADWFSQKFGIPKPKDGEKVLEPRPTTVPFGSSLAKGLLGSKLDLFS